MKFPVMVMWQDNKWLEGSSVYRTACGVLTTLCLCWVSQHFNLRNCSEWPYVNFGIQFCSNFGCTWSFYSVCCFVVCCEMPLRMQVAARAQHKNGVMLVKVF